jgi:DNA invertase Pin-like site-specific DNA recombinase
MKKPVVRKLRCAVYTRKSTEEGLHMEFNSLDAQREACESYVASQKAEGWTLVPDRYDDGGFSGATLERPALRRLIGDIEAGGIDVVVVYKIDRLSRSLMDFAKLVEILDRNSVTFVSVTQAFNTTTSMGRLTLNILLSFAQFEREVIGERIRDKFAASRKRGIWMGGWAPLGYDIRDRKLVINAVEAVSVRTIFQRFARVGSTCRERPRSRAAEQRDEVAPFQLIELHSVPATGLQGYRIGRDQSAAHARSSNGDGPTRGQVGTIPAKMACQRGAGGGRAHLGNACSVQPNCGKFERQSIYQSL